MTPTMNTLKKLARRISPPLHPVTISDMDVGEIWVNAPDGYIFLDIGLHYIHSPYRWDCGARLKAIDRREAIADLCQDLQKVLENGGVVPCPDPECDTCVEVA